MCTQPLYIKNKKYKSLYVKIPNSYIKVPCGQCDECLRKRARDLYVRAKFEIEDCIIKGGSAFMCCLTYDDAHVPTLTFEGKTYMVFNKKHVQDFIKRLRTNLDRFYVKNYGTLAPDFKYLATSEFGTDPTRSHRPHIHLDFASAKPISYYAFRKAFVESLVNRRDKKRVFGFIYQCDPLDIKKNGISYSCKYILKDQTYSNQNEIIHKLIDFHSHAINQEFNIIEFPESQEDFFHNKCIRSTKEYKQAIKTRVSPYRNMLQFYLISNDFGCSAICNRYGKNLFSLGMLNIDGFAYSIPKQVVQRLERTQGSDKRDIIVKTTFLRQFDQSLSTCLVDNSITKHDAETLKLFADKFIQPRFGALYFIHPSGVTYWNLISDSPLRDYDNLFEEFRFYDDNNFFDLRNCIYKVIDLANSKEHLDFRAKLARIKSKKERENYEKKKRNKPSLY